ncbi:MAG TPA: methyltransferase domain-containing protein [Candidatus Eisenbacteria bacterium]|nr:methyltransferase domain-containing protein [Candidatus Eisenbacteria bacterium]
MSRPGEDAILAELVRRSIDHPEDQLVALGSLVGARQYRMLYRLCRKYLPEGSRVLDWGAGNGHFSYFLQRSGYRAEGFSLLEPRFTRWLPDPSYAFTQGDPRDPVTLPYGDGTFDGVVSVGVLEHVRETGGSEAKSLAEIARVLRPGGAFLCYHFPNRYSWIDWAARRVPGMHHHDYRYTRGEIRRLAAGAGLHVVEVRRYGILPRNSGARLPRSLRTSGALARAWDAVDGGLAIPLSLFCQNYCFVAVKTGSARSSGGRTERNAR